MALIAIHPGEHLAEELDALDMSAVELARKIEVPPQQRCHPDRGVSQPTTDLLLRV
jgi:plasmid maintenance system antidote protein VapI